MKRLIFLLNLFLSVTLLYGQQTLTINGKVTDTSGAGMPGVSVSVKGTTHGVVTDANGAYSMQASGQATLVFSFVGFKSHEVPVNNRGIINLVMEEEVVGVEEVVVVGYGTQKVKDLTSSISTVKSDDLAKTPASQPMNALQGKVAGVQIVNDGGPGNSATVRIRGIGSFPGMNNEAPLYVVDGMFYDNIDFLNPTDIETISVLKDASAAAIYGVRAANGVILIETRSGSYNQKTKISYDGYEGYQIDQNVLKMANAQQYTAMANESGSATEVQDVLNSMQKWGRSRVDPNIPVTNTDWYKQVIRDGQIRNHSVGIDGGTEKAKYSLGVNYFYQDGTLKELNNYERMNLRSKVDIKATKWLTVGENMIFSNATKYLDASQAWYNTYFAVPIFPVYDLTNTAAIPFKYASADPLGYRGGQNPFPGMVSDQDQQKILKALATIYMEITLIPKVLTFKSTYNNSYTQVNERVVDLPWFIDNNFQNPHGTLTKTTSSYMNQYWDNILTFTKSFGSHNLTLMAGTSYKDETYQMLSAKGVDFPTLPQSWYIAQSLTIPSTHTDVNDDGLHQYGFSYFGRAAYNYQEKYLLYGTMRADGSSKYQEKWGYFPTVGAGWVVSEENFLKNNDFVPFLKLRGSWGELGNDHIQASDGARTTSVVNTTMGGNLVSGTIAQNTFSSLKWEKTEETNIGLTARFLHNRLSADIDYFSRDTKNAAIPVNIPLIGGSVLKAVGTIRNSGFECTLNWSDKITDKLSYNIGANFATLKNQVRNLYGQPYINYGTPEFQQRSYVGHPLNAYYGWKIAGVYQNQAQINADPIAVANGLVPGDFKYVDKNHDGVIDGSDRVILGSYFPNLTYGGNIGLKYQNFDLSANFYGQSGNSILNRRRGEMLWTNDGNLDADLAVNRWHGDGTSNKYPSSAGLLKVWNQKMSDYFVNDGKFWRIQNVQVGYTFKNQSWLNGNFPETRIFLTADHPLTHFKYQGFTPEVANGYDDVTYPIPAIYTIGLNIKF